MDDGRPPDFLVIALTLILGVFLVQAVFFSKILEIGVFVVLSVFIYFLFFVMRDKEIKKRHLNNSLRVRENKFDLDFSLLPKNIP